MVVRVHGGIINDQMLDGSLRYFDIEELNMMVNTIGDSGGRVAEASIVDAGSSYANGNVLTVSGGTFATAATLTLLTPGVGMKFNDLALVMLVTTAFFQRTQFQ